MGNFLFSISPMDSAYTNRCTHTQVATDTDRQLDSRDRRTDGQADRLG